MAGPCSCVCMCVLVGRSLGETGVNWVGPAGGCGRARANPERASGAEVEEVGGIVCGNWCAFSGPKQLTRGEVRR